MRRTLKFAIRDDDTSFFTDPQELINCYGEIWEKVPVSLSIVPFQVPYECEVIPAVFRGEKRSFPIHENPELISFLKKMAKAGRISVMLHGYEHRDYSEGPEFKAGDGLERKAIEGKRYLEEVLDVKVHTFVPPHNSISKEGLRAVVNAGMNIVGIQSFRPSMRGFDPRAFLPGVVRTLFLRLSGYEYPYPLRVGSHFEIPYTTLSPLVSEESLNLAFSMALKWRGVFCLSTHYWEMGKVIASSRTVTLRDALLKLLESAFKIEGVGFVDVDGLTAGLD